MRGARRRRKKEEGYEEDDEKQASVEEIKQALEKIKDEKAIKIDEIER